MKKYTDKDIQKMLEKTEKTKPSFDKDVSFAKAAFPRKRVRRFTSFAVAACIAAFTMVGTVFIFAMNRDGAETSAPFQSAASSDFSYDMPDSSFVSVPHVDYSNDYSDAPDESRDPQGDNSIVTESSDVSDPPHIDTPMVEYPNDTDFFIGQGMSINGDPAEYFSANPNKHLEAKLKLPVYTRDALTFADRTLFMETFGESIRKNFEFDETLYGITGDFRGTAQNGMLSLNISEYGDWYLYISSGSLLYVYNENELDGEVFISAVREYVLEHTSIFDTAEYTYSVSYGETRIHISLSAGENSDPILAKLPTYTFSFRKLSGNNYGLSSIEHVVNGMYAIGEYETRLYSSAIEELFDNNFWSEYDPEYSNSGIWEFAIVGHDVRYLYSAKNESMLPFYAFVIKINPYGNESSLQTVFVPAIADEFIISADDIADVSG